MYENKLLKRGLGPKTQRWTEIWDTSDPIKNEELILRNTYINSQQGPWAEFSKINPSGDPQKTINYEQNNALIKWRDNQSVPFSQQSSAQMGQNSQQTNGQKSPLSFVCGGGGAGLQNATKGAPAAMMSITQEYPEEQDLLHKQKILKQQNHYIYQKDTIQMRRNILPILRKRAKSAQSAHKAQGFQQ